MRYSSSAHTRFYHRYHVVWATKYRYKVLHGAMRERIRQIIIQTCEELGVHIVKDVLARDHVHMFLSIPPKLSLSDVMQRIKGRSSRRIQMEFPDLRKRYWGRRFWARGYCSTTSGNVTDDVIRQYLELHSFCNRAFEVKRNFQHEANGRTVGLASTVCIAGGLNYG